MSLRTLRLAFALFWLLVSLTLFMRHQIAPPEWENRMASPNLSLGAWLALLLAMWNMMRGWQTQTASKSIRRVQPDREQQAREYHPEFDFREQPDSQPPDNRERGG
jgi:hypothetical protein